MMVVPPACHQVVLQIVVVVTAYCVLVGSAATPQPLTPQAGHIRVTHNIRPAAVRLAVKLMTGQVPLYNPVRHLEKSADVVSFKDVFTNLLQILSLLLNLIYCSLLSAIVGRGEVD